MKNKITALTTVGVALASSLVMTAATAESNPFAMTELDSGYMQLAEADMRLDKAKEASCGEGKCGNMMNKAKTTMKKGMESSCGSMMKGKEGACGDMKAKKSHTNKVSTSGWGNKKAKEAKCGEGKCGDMMDKAQSKMKKGKENSCGAMMKGKEGACGMGMKGGMKEGGMKKMKMGEGMCGGMMKGGMKKMKMGEGMCGGGMMKGGMGKMKEGMEHKCGGMKGKMKGGMGGMGSTKGSEASCGSMISKDKAAGQ